MAPVSRPATRAAAITDVVAGYGARTVLDRVSLRLDHGEVYVLIGPNGAGKSSLVRLLTGALRPRAGRVEVEGGPRTIGLVPQEIALYPWLSPRENGFAFARIEGIAPAEAHRRVRRALAMSACEAVADTPVARLSGGYRRRANIAASLVKNPRLLILDEPTAGVDLDARRAIAACIRAVKAEGTAVLLVTHDFEDADALADRAGVLIDGRIRDEGPPRDLVRRAHGRRKRIEIVLAEAPDAAGIAALTAEGAAPLGPDTVWLAFRDMEGWDARPVLAALEARGLEVREARLREPGLESVYLALRQAA